MKYLPKKIEDEEATSLIIQHMKDKNYTNYTIKSIKLFLIPCWFITYTNNEINNFVIDSYSGEVYEGLEKVLLNPNIELQDEVTILEEYSKLEPRIENIDIYLEKILNEKIKICGKMLIYIPFWIVKIDANGKYTIKIDAYSGIIYSNIPERIILNPKEPPISSAQKIDLKEFKNYVFKIISLKNLDLDEILIIVGIIIALILLIYILISLLLHS